MPPPPHSAIASDAPRPVARRYTRRRALQGAGVALIGAWLFTGSAPAMADDGTLEPGRAAALAAILAALAQGPAAGLDTAAYLKDFDAFYTSAHTPFRDYADGALDAVAAETAFLLAAPADAYAQLRTWATEPPRQLMVGSALELASLSFEEDELKTPGYGLVTGAAA